MPEPAGPARRALRTLLLVAATALMVAAAGWWAVGQEPLPEESGVERRAAPVTGVTRSPVIAPREPGSPRRVAVPALGVDARVLPVESVDDVLVPPADPQRLGWWADGAEPGAGTGSILVAGHTVRRGSGALDHLEQLTAGDRVMVRTDRGRLTYEVTAVHIYDKGRLATVADRVFSQTVPERLVLITCEDWDGTRYRANVVVLARPVR
jgi:LPXTG-site transpeptidase (sortase) family protein